MKLHRIAMILFALLQTGQIIAQNPEYPKKYFSPFPAPVKKHSTHYISTEELTYKQPPKDSLHKSVTWIAPAGTITDWASIPKICVPLIGLPDDERWYAAALVHDAYCGEDNKGGASYHQAPWREVHRMFRDACISGGTPKMKANMMFAAVYLYGTRNKWVYQNGVEQTIAYADRQKSGISEEEKAAANLDLSGVSDSLVREQFEEINLCLRHFEQAQKEVMVTPFEQTLNTVALIQHRNEVLTAGEIAEYYSFAAKGLEASPANLKEFSKLKKEYNRLRKNRNFIKYTQYRNASDPEVEDLNSIAELKHAIRVKKKMINTASKWGKMPKFR